MRVFVTPGINITVSVVDPALLHFDIFAYVVQATYGQKWVVVHKILLSRSQAHEVDSSSRETASIVDAFSNVTN